MATTTQKTVGVIGIGTMGMAVAQRLLQHGYAVHARDIDTRREQQAHAHGASIAASPAALAAQCDIIVTLVVDDKQTDLILFGADGAVHSSRPGSVVILCSTVAPHYAVSAAQRLGERGIGLLDAPVSGGPARARNGEMSMMLAGSDEDYARCVQTLTAMSNRLFRVSARVGDGARMKLVNNALAAANLAAGCEAIALGLRLGLDGQRMLEVIGASSGASWVVTERMVRAFAQDYAPRAATTLLAKDVGLFLEQARAAGFHAPLAQSAHAAFLRAVERGYGALDDAVLLKQYLEQ